MYEYRVISVNKIVDGDTIDITIDLGFRLTKTLRIRMIGYDAPELYRPRTDKEKEAAIICTNKLKELLLSAPVDSDIRVKTYKDPGIYGRWAGEIFVNEESVNQQMKDFIESNGYTKEKLREGV